MSEVRPTYDHEISIYEVIGALWHGRWTIIATTFVAAVVGIVFSVVKPNSFEVSSPLQSGKAFNFFEYTLLNDLLERNQLSYAIEEKSIFKMFIAEFNDYEEMVDAVGTSKLVQESVKDLNDDDKKRALIEFARAFEIKPPSGNQQVWRMSFVWHDVVEGKQLINDAIRQTLSNVRNVSLTNVNTLAEIVELRNAQKLEKLRSDLSVIKQKQEIRNKKRIQFLIEQSAIAKELGIETNRLDSNALSQSSQNSISLSVSSQDVPFYLRGHKAIDEEILLIQNRSGEENALAAPGYLQMTEKILLLEQDTSPSQINKASEAIATDNTNEWIEVDLAIADVKSFKKPNLYVALSTVFGGMIGVIFLYIKNGIWKRKEQSA